MVKPGRAQTFTEHLEELRVRIIICVVFSLFTFAVSFFFAPKVVEVLIAPLTRIAPAGEPPITLVVADDGTLRLALDDHSLTKTLETLASASKRRGQMEQIVIRFPNGVSRPLFPQKSRSSLFFLSPIEPFMLLVKGALLLSALFSIPMAIYQLWLFITPGLLPRERRIVKPILQSSLILFPAGAAFAYFLAHFMLQVLLSFGEYIPGLEANIVASKYIGFILTLMLAFGLVFEFPLVLLLLARIGLIDSTFLAQRRKFAIVLIAVLSAAITPTPDPVNMSLMMAPLVILYEISIWVIRSVEHAGSLSGISSPEKSS